MRTLTNTFKTMALLCAAIGWTQVQAQIPAGNEGINYQAIARDGGGAVLVSTALTVTVDIKSGDPTPVSEYTETHSVTTNAYGQFSLVMGEGTPSLGTYAAIDWDADKHWYAISIFDGSTTVVMPDVPFQAVPYAHTAGSAVAGNTLDDAYDEGVLPGDGRIIAVDAMPVELEVAGDNNGLMVRPQHDDMGTAADNGIYVKASHGTSATGLRVEFDSLGLGDAIIIQQGDGSLGKGLHINQDGSGDAVEINSTSGTAIEVNNDGLDPSVIINHLEIISTENALEVNNDGTADGIEVNSTDGISLELNNTGDDASAVINHTTVTSATNALTVNNDGTATALELNATDGIAVEVNNTGDEGSIIVTQTDATSAANGVELNHVGTGDVLEINNTDGIGLEINNSGPAATMVLAQSTPASVATVATMGTLGLGKVLEVAQGNAVNGADAATVYNSGFGKALLVEQVNPIAAMPAMMVDNAGAAEAVKVTHFGPANGVEVDNFGGGSGVHVNNLGAGVGMSVAAPFGDGVLVTTDNTVSTIGDVSGGGADGSAGTFVTIPNVGGGPDAIEPTLDVLNTVTGHAAVFNNTGAATLATVRVGNAGLGSAMSITSATHGDHVLVVESEAGFHSEGAAKFFNTDAASFAPNVVEMSSSLTGAPGHSVLDVIAAAVTDQAANFEGKVDIGGDILAGGDVTVSVGSVDVATGSVSIGDDLIVGDDMSAVDGTFTGDLAVTGTLSKGAGTFKIDHPQDPDNKYLYHSFVESPDMMNIYNGNVKTDDEGFATVELPSYFESLNIEFRYQLTVIGSFAQAIVKDEVSENAFRIQTNEPNVKVSWLVTGVRNDDYARENRVQVEVDKEEANKGTRLYQPVTQ